MSDVVLSIVLGIGLAAATGFRAMLEALKRLNGETIHLPGRVKDHPDWDRLAQRFEWFKAVP